MKAKACFIIDATGSMSAWIEAAKSQTKQIVETIKEATPGVELEIAAVFYRDFGDKVQHVVVPFTADVTQYLASIAGVEAYGGGDTCEDVAGGIEKMLSLDWTGADVCNAFLICDAPPHGREWHSVLDGDRFPDNDYNLTQLLLDTKAANIKLAVIRVNPIINPMIEKMSAIDSNLVVLDMIIQSELPLPFVPPIPGRLPDPRTVREHSWDYLPGDPVGHERLTLARHISRTVTQSIAASQDPF
jgi:hypothetical protein